MPALQGNRTADKVVAIFCSDIHLRLRPPIARIDEPDWFKAMARPLIEISNLAGKHEAIIICAGDVFDKWNSPPELTNFALTYLSEFINMCSIPGQHDLPLHNFDLIEKSAYHTLVLAGKISSLVPSYTVLINKKPEIRIIGFPWGSPIKKPDWFGDRKDVKLIAVAHQYAWVDGYNYPNAPEEGKISKARKELQDFDVVVFGDNHKGFLTKCGNTTIFNCGGLMRMKSDEVHNKPMVGLLYESGEIKPHYLDIDNEIITTVEPTKVLEEDLELKDFIEELCQLQEMGLDFREAMKRVLEEKKPSQEVKEIILKAMEDKR